LCTLCYPVSVRVIIKPHIATEVEGVLRGPESLPDLAVWNFTSGGGNQRKQQK